MPFGFVNNILLFSEYSWLVFMYLVKSTIVLAIANNCVFIFCKSLLVTTAVPISALPQNMMVYSKYTFYLQMNFKMLSAGFLHVR